MPRVRIDLSRAALRARAAIAAQVVYDAMRTVAAVSEHDRFQTITRHDPDEIVTPAAGHPDVTSSPDIVMIEVSWVASRSTAV